MSAQREHQRTRQLDWQRPAVTEVPVAMAANESHFIPTPLSPVARLLADPQAQFLPEETAALEQRLARGLPGSAFIRPPRGSQFLGVGIDFYLTRPHPNYPQSQQELMVAKFAFGHDNKLVLDTLRIPEQGDFQRQGWGRTFTRNLVAEALDHGVSRITMRTEKIGSYFWLKCGGVCAPDSRFSPNDWVINNASTDLKQRYNAHLRERDYWGIADLAEGNRKYGFPLTNDIQWEGFIDLQNPRVLNRLESYLGIKSDQDITAQRPLVLNLRRDQFVNRC